MTAVTLPRLGAVYERCAYCGTDHDVCHIMYPEGWPLCSRCERANGAEVLRAELYTETGPSATSDGLPTVDVSTVVSSLREA